MERRWNTDISGYEEQLGIRPHVQNACRNNLRDLKGLFADLPKTNCSIWNRPALTNASDGTRCSLLLNFTPRCSIYLELPRISQQIARVAGSFEPHFRLGGAIFCLGNGGGGLSVPLDTRVRYRLYSIGLRDLTIRLIVPEMIYSVSNYRMLKISAIKTSPLHSKSMQPYPIQMMRQQEILLHSAVSRPKEVVLNQRNEQQTQQVLGVYHHRKPEDISLLCCAPAPYQQTVGLILTSADGWVADISFS